MLSFLSHIVNHRLLSFRTTSHSESRPLLFVRLPGRKNTVVVFLALVTAGLLVANTVRFDIKGHFDGLFLLKGKGGWSFELKDDLYVGDSERLIYAVDFGDPRYQMDQFLHHRQHGQPYLYADWDEKEGSGYIRNFLPNGGQLFTSFGRFMDDDGRYVHGLFVGGGCRPASWATTMLS